MDPEIETAPPSPVMLLMIQPTGWLRSSGTALIEGLRHWPLDPEETWGGRNLAEALWDSTRTSVSQTWSERAVDDLIAVYETLIARGVSIQGCLGTKATDLAPAAVQAMFERLDDGESLAASVLAGKLFKTAQHASSVGDGFGTLQALTIQASAKRNMSTMGGGAKVEPVIAGMPAHVWLVCQAAPAGQGQRCWVSGSVQERTTGLRLLLRLVKSSGLLQSDNHAWRTLAACNLRILAEDGITDRKVTGAAKGLAGQLMDGIDPLQATHTLVQDTRMADRTRVRAGALLAHLGDWTVTAAALPLLYAGGPERLSASGLACALRKTGQLPEALGDFLDAAGRVDGACGMHAGMALFTGAYQGMRVALSRNEQVPGQLLQALSERCHTLGVRAVMPEDLGSSGLFGWSDNASGKAAMDAYRMECATATPRGPGRAGPRL